MNRKFEFYNRVFGWLVFAISATVYLLTLEPTTSLWDCGEFIASAFKLQVGHPPGAPFFMILARFFSLFAGNNVSKVALMINGLSGIASAATIMFLFWTITHLAAKMLKSNRGLITWQTIIVFGSAFVGSLAYTFSDTFWFSAVEGEVYASSSLFTAVVFWAILKWENVANEKYSNRWIILIAFLMGLSIGVHLLNLLAIPAIVMVYYYKKYTFSWKGIFTALIVSVLILGGIMYMIIPGVVWVASLFELLFVNSFGLPYNSGVLFYAAALIAAMIYGILYSYKKRKVLANTIILVITVIILGYSSFTMIVIRSLADPPMDENSPETVFSLMYYLNREQYGDRPLFKGQYFNAPRPTAKEGRATYTPIDGKYVKTNRKTKLNYDKDYTTIFPRMYSSSPDHIQVYLNWGGLEEKDLYLPRYDNNGKMLTDRDGKLIYDRSKPKRKPSFKSNLKFFFSYQLGHMYMRYFMWNFSGRQNNEQADGGPLYGNWITGINFIDNSIIGSTKKMPDEIKDHPSRNRYYLLPLLLGILGILAQSGKKKDFSVVAVLFVLTGIAIVVYLNQTPLQPRERDYAYAGSFYAFAIWIGLGVYGILDLLGRKFQNTPFAILASVLCLFVPILMANENWDDHDRSGRYLARDIAYNYLNSCEPNAILFTGGDNDTFPLWYAQEVEGIRTDVRVVNLMLLNMDWYIDQMKRKAYESDALPLTMPSEKYRNGTRDAIPVYERSNQVFDANDILEVMLSDLKSTKLPSQSGVLMDYVPARNFYIPVDPTVVLANGTVDSVNASRIVDSIKGRINGGYLTKSNLAVLDIIRNNNWQRPVYYVATNQSDELGLSDYLQLDGFAYRLVPISTPRGSDYDRGRIDSEIMYNNLMNKFKYGRMNENDVFLDNFHRRTLQVVRLRHRFVQLANLLASEGDNQRAEEVLDRIVELTPHDKVPYDMFMPGIADGYYSLAKFEKGSEIVEKLIDISDSHLEYYGTFNKKQKGRIEEEVTYHLRILANLSQMCRQYNQTDLAIKAQDLFNKYGNLFSML